MSLIIRADHRGILKEILLKRKSLGQLLVLMRPFTVKILTARSRRIIRAGL
jgi:hypothetical protein